MPAAFSRVFAAPLLAAALLFSSPAQAADCAGFGIVKAAAASFGNAARSRSAAAFSSALARHSDVTSLAMFALGPYRKDLPKSRQGEYIRNANRFMGQFLAGNANRINASGLKVSGCKGNLVETEAGGREMVWRISGGRVQDVRIAGVWLAGQLRSKFTGMIRNRGGDINAFIDQLGGSAVASN